MRVANAGITAAVDAHGRVRARFPTDVAGAWVVDVQPSDAASVYARAGDAFACLAALGAVVALARVPRRGPRDAEPLTQPAERPMRGR